ncbi:MAG: response regulator receiver protein [Pedosphaera sp.]|nr:response regulator receiver protein [Pedosphaera sp.]
MSKLPKENYRVLMADDSEDDRLLMRLAFRNNPAFVLVGEVENGEAAIDYLTGKGEFSDREKYPFPDLLLLDLKMPQCDGFMVLKWLRDQIFPKLKVVVLSGDSVEEDVAKTSELGAHGYQLKAASILERQKNIRSLEETLVGV